MQRCSNYKRPTIVESIEKRCSSNCCHILKFRFASRLFSSKQKLHPFYPCRVTESIEKSANRTLLSSSQAFLRKVNFHSVGIVKFKIHSSSCQASPV